MARITVEDCLKKVDNRFALIHLAAKRVRQLRKGDEVTVSCKNKDIVVALREIAAERVFPMKREEDTYATTSLEEPAVEEIPAQTDLESPDKTETDQEPVPEEK